MSAPPAPPGYTNVYIGQDKYSGRPVYEQRRTYTPAPAPASYAPVPASYAPAPGPASTVHGSMGMGYHSGDRRPYNGGTSASAAALAQDGYRPYDDHARHPDKYDAYGKERYPPRERNVEPYREKRNTFGDDIKWAAKGLKKARTFAKNEYENLPRPLQNVVGHLAGEVAGKYAGPVAKQATHLYMGHSPAGPFPQTSAPRPQQYSSASQQPYSSQPQYYSQPPSQGRY